MASSLTYRPRSLARLAAVQAIYQWEHSAMPIQAIMDDFVEHGVIFEEETLPLSETELFKQVVEGVHDHQDAIDNHIAQRLAQGWRIGRLDSVLRAILRCGIYELMVFNHIDVPVIISEYITIASGFLDAKQGAFVNGLLDNAAQGIRGNTTVQKQ